MQLILLSGGSGKRLWPLSNDARSKQFLHLLKGPDGSFESMIQRVARQIRESGLDAELTFATNAVQRDSIINQLGEGLGIVTEPERRDTFPAIALACGYLAKEKKCPDSETVVVMPCDVYTESGYFRTIASMASAVEQDAADIVLMGIEPDCPSEKFGYIVPSQDGPDGLWRKVERFTEKPDAARAAALLEQGAVWNGGVFAFRLGYIRALVDKYVPAESFEELRSRYGELPKISFDYEVVEKAPSVAFVSYRGRWKDLGTWNALCDELSDTHIGNVLMGPDNVNTHAINELGLPLFCEGLKDVVVAVSPDGIMVCSKPRSEQIKDYVSSLVSRPMYEERRWGSYRVLDSQSYADGSKSLTKTLTIKAGKGISYQVHHHRSEVWTIVEGEGEFVLDGVRRKVARADVLNIPVGHLHAIRATTGDLTLIEVQLGNPLVEEDIERFDWQW